MECAICLQRCVHPVRLPCSHVFCFLCVKGAANLSKSCALCRQELPETFFDDPNLVEGIKGAEVQRYEDGIQWFYEGRNGWWLYDKRTSDEMEAAFKEGRPRCELLIAGFLYVLDFEKMLQFRRSDERRKRRIKREQPLDSSVVKGIAGLFCQIHPPSAPSSSSDPAQATATAPAPASAPAREPSLQQTSDRVPPKEGNVRETGITSGTSVGNTCHSSGESVEIRGRGRGTLSLPVRPQLEPHVDGESSVTRGEGSLLEVEEDAVSEPVGDLSNRFSQVLDVRNRDYHETYL